MVIYLFILLLFLTQHSFIGYNSYHFFFATIIEIKFIYHSNYLQNVYFMNIICDAHRVSCFWKKLIVHRESNKKLKRGGLFLAYLLSFLFIKPVICEWNSNLISSTTGSHNNFYPLSWEHNFNVNYFNLDLITLCSSRHDMKNWKCLANEVLNFKERRYHWPIWVLIIF